MRAMPACASITCCSIRAIAGRLEAAEVDRRGRGWEKASDHAPTWIKLADGKPSPKRAQTARM